jgi:hypothetical protein
MDTVTPATAAPIETPSQVDSTPEKAETKEAKPTAAEIRKYKLKIDDQEVEVDEEELKAGYGTRKASTKRFEEASAMKRQIEEAKKKAKEDPRAFLKAHGLDPRSLSEELLWAELQEEALTPQEKELKSYKQKIAEYEAQKQAQEAEQLEQRIAIMEKEQTEIMTKELIDSLSQYKLPKSKFSIQMIVSTVQEADKHGYDLKIPEAARLVRKQLDEFNQDNLRNLEGDDLREYAGEDTLKKLRNEDVKKLKAPFGKPIPRKESDDSGSDNSKPKEKMSWSEWQDSIAKKAQGKR